MATLKVKRIGAKFVGLRKEIRIKSLKSKKKMIKKIITMSSDNPYINVVEIHIVWEMT